MAKHDQAAAARRSERLERNRTLMRTILAGGDCRDADASDDAGIGLVLERFVVDEGQRRAVPFEGAHGVERLLAGLEEQGWVPIVRDGHVTGVEGTLALEGCEAPVPVRATVGAGGQVALELGPADRIARLLDALAVLDRHAHLSARAMGRSYTLLPQGYHPFVASPSDVVVVPTAEHVLANAHLSRTGRYARDALRCTAATRVRLAMPPAEEDAVSAFRLATALAPLLAFLTDNCLRVRGGSPEGAPRMARSLAWDHLDPTRCGMPEDTFGQGFGFDSYERWLEGIRPIYFQNASGVTFSTGDDDCRRLMEERELGESEARVLLRRACTWARWDGALELAAADALGPRQAGAYAALVRGLLEGSQGRTRTGALIGADSLGSTDVTAAWQALRAEGWEARAYGRPAWQLAHELVSIACSCLDDPAERRLVDQLAQLWDVRMVPRDALLGAWRRNRPRSREEEAARRWGAGAVIPYDELQGEPPAGSTAVMSLDRLRQDHG